MQNMLYCVKACIYLTLYSIICVHVELHAYTLSTLLVYSLTVIVKCRVLKAKWFTFHLFNQRWKIAK